MLLLLLRHFAVLKMHGGSQNGPLWKKMFKLNMASLTWKSAWKMFVARLPAVVANEFLLLIQSSEIAALTLCGVPVELASCH